MSNNTMDTVAILETTSMRWELEEPPTIAQIKERGGDTSDLYRWVRQISRLANPARSSQSRFRIGCFIVTRRSMTMKSRQRYTSSRFTPSSAMSRSTFLD